jgi:hypothetical protein
MRVDAVGTAVVRDTDAGGELLDAPVEWRCGREPEALGRAVVGDVAAAWLGAEPLHEFGLVDRRRSGCFGHQICFQG